MITIFRYFAPIFFILCAGLRCFLETSIFGKTDFFSYYTLTHHILWYLSAMLASILTLNVLLKLRFKHLNWLLYSGVIFFIPIGYAVVTGEKLDMKYLDPMPLTILKSSLSGCLLNPSNRPQFFEIIIIDTGIFIIGWLASKNIKKALVTMVILHAVLTLFGVQWFYSKPGSPGLLRIATRLSNHVWLSLVWLFSASFFVQIFLLKTDGVKTRQNLAKGMISGIVLWTGTVLALLYFQKEMALFDACAITIPLYTAGLITTTSLLSGENKLPGHVQALIFSTLGAQLVVILPIVLNIRQALITPRIVVPF